MKTIQVHAEHSKALQASLDAIASLKQTSPEAVEKFLDSGDPLVRVVQAHPENLPAEQTSDVFLLLEPSDGLLKFVSAMRTSEIDHV